MNTRTILLVEDNPGDIGLTKRAMAKANIANKLVVVEDGQEALDYVFGTGHFAMGVMAKRMLHECRDAKGFLQWQK